MFIKLKNIKLKKYSEKLKEIVEDKSESIEEVMHKFDKVLNHIKLGIAIIFWEGLSSIGLPSNFFLCS